jgi:hypothetical protein
LQNTNIFKGVKIMIRNEVKLIGRLTAEIIVDEVDYLGFTKKGIDKSENIPDLDPNHKSQEEYQMIHNALSESEDLPF